MTGTDAYVSPLRQRRFSRSGFRLAVFLIREIRSGENGASGRLKTVASVAIGVRRKSERRGGYRAHPEDDHDGSEPQPGDAERHPRRGAPLSAALSFVPSRTNRPASGHPCANAADRMGAGETHPHRILPRQSDRQDADRLGDVDATFGRLLLSIQAFPLRTANGPGTSD